MSQSLLGRARFEPDANGLYLGAPPLRNQKFADSPVEGDGFELPVRERGASGCRPFVAPDAWDGSTRPFLPIDSRAPP